MPDEWTQDLMIRVDEWKSRVQDDTSRLEVVLSLCNLALSRYDTESMFADDILVMISERESLSRLYSEIHSRDSSKILNKVGEILDSAQNVPLSTRRSATSKQIEAVTAEYERLLHIVEREDALKRELEEKLKLIDELKDKLSDVESLKKEIRRSDDEIVDLSRVLASSDMNCISDSIIGMKTYTIESFQMFKKTMSGIIPVEDLDLLAEFSNIVSTWNRIDDSSEAGMWDGIQDTKARINDYLDSLMESLRAPEPTVPRIPKSSADSIGMLSKKLRDYIISHP